MTAFALLTGCFREIGLTPSESARLFLLLPEEHQRLFWDDLAKHIAATRGTA
jgi:hypothetical protein